MVLNHRKAFHKLCTVCPADGNDFIMDDETVVFDIHDLVDVDDKRPVDFNELMVVQMLAEVL